MREVTKQVREDPATPTGVAKPYPAATVTLVRDAPGGLEVLLLKRSEQLRFMPGVYVFPGGGLDAADASPELQARCTGMKDVAASRALGLERGGLAYWVAAIREAFEEAGILLAYDAAGRIVDFDGEAAERFHAYRGRLDREHGAFGGILAKEDLRLATDRLTYFGHWITPVTVPRRYDTRFFLAVAPERQRAMHDNTETVDHVWLRPRDALEADARKSLGLRLPTIKTLERFAACATTADLEAMLRADPAVRTLLPRVTADGRSVLPGDEGYDSQ